MSEWMDYLAPGMVAHAVLVLTIVAALGLVLGSLGFRGIRLGTAGVLFVGLMLGQAGLSINHDILEFVRDFGLILFVYTVGLEVGPSFFSSLKRHGLRLNLIASAIVLLGGLLVVAFRFLFHFSLPTVAGLFSGATTNTPSLAAGQAALQNLPQLPAGSTDLLGMAYAIAYPFGVVGIILTMLLIEKTFRLRAEPETGELDSLPESDAQALDAVDLQVTNPNCDGITIGNLPFRKESGIIFSRLLSNGKVTVPEDDSAIHVGDTLRLVGPRAKLSRFETVIGQKSRVNLGDISDEIGVEQLHVTKREVLGKS